MQAIVIRVDLSRSIEKRLSVIGAPHVHPGLRGTQIQSNISLRTFGQSRIEVGRFLLFPCQPDTCTQVQPECQRFSSGMTATSLSPRRTYLDRDTVRRPLAELLDHEVHDCSWRDSNIAPILQADPCDRRRAQSAGQYGVKVVSQRRARGNVSDDLWIAAEQKFSGKLKTVRVFRISIDDPSKQLLRFLVAPHSSRRSALIRPILESTLVVVSDRDCRSRPTASTVRLDAQRIRARTIVRHFAAQSSLLAAHRKLQQRNRFSSAHLALHGLGARRRFPRPN